MIGSNESDCTRNTRKVAGFRAVGIGQQAGRNPPPFENLFARLERLAGADAADDLGHRPVERRLVGVLRPRATVGQACKPQCPPAFRARQQHEIRAWPEAGAQPIVRAVEAGGGQFKVLIFGRRKPHFPLRDSGARYGAGFGHVQLRQPARLAHQPQPGADGFASFRHGGDLFCLCHQRLAPELGSSGFAFMGHENLFCFARIGFVLDRRRKCRFPAFILTKGQENGPQRRRNR